MIDRVHGDASDCGSDAQPSASPSFPELAFLVLRVASNSKGGTNIPRDLPDLPTRQLDVNVLRLPLFDILLILANNGSVRASTPAKLPSASRLQPHVVD